ncbi:YSIRK-type signal peptide-containing protein [Staphylococcus sp. IVB6181]|uniref:YSIRK-type signal peptide-containing protein n=1 Tax=Staphylococcus sp. IVB6181 TaxID=2929481 RepID=UPI002934A46B|nr:YSIRK-type signal peptide-containing protein [Staphylococcus sp. IVB6181]
MKKNNKPLDFLPNILNKYSIRKFTVGTASILVSSLLFLGISNDASASTESDTSNTNTTKANVESPPSDTATAQPESNAVQTKAAEQPKNTESQPVTAQTDNQTTGQTDTHAAPSKVQTTDNSTSVEQTSEKTTVQPAPSESKTSSTANTDQGEGHQYTTRSVQDGVPGSSLNATDDMIGPNPVTQTGVQNSSELPVLSQDQIKNINHQITWLDFSDKSSIKNAETTPEGQIALKVGTQFQKEIMPGLVVTATVKSLQPFQATPIYARRAESDPESGYDPHAINITRKDSEYVPSEPAHIVLFPQDAYWSHLKRAGVDTGSHLTNFSSNKNYGNVGATFDVKVTLDGVEVPANIIMSDGEEAKGTESLIYTTNGTGWQLFANVRNIYNTHNYIPLSKDNQEFINAVDKGGYGKGQYYATPDPNFGGLGTQVFGPNQTRQDQNSVPIVLTTDATEVSFFVNTAGIQTVQMGFVVLDKGDAPSSYGEAVHAITENGTVSQPYLGTVKADVDIDTPNKVKEPWKTDDINTPVSSSGPDEGEQELTGQNNNYFNYLASNQTHTLDVIANTGNNDTSFVRGWVDFNNNGVFDEGEASEVVTVPRTGANGSTIKLVFKNSPQITNTDLDYLGVRVRTSLAKDSILKPVGVAYSGEVEDFEIKVIHPPRGEKEETTGMQGQTQSAKVDFTAYGKVERDWPKENAIDTNQPVKIVDSSGNLVSTLTVPGEGKYDVAPDGTVSFTPEPSFVGTAKGIVLRGTDLNGNTSGWDSNTVANNLENINKGINGTNTMDSVYIPTVTRVTPSAEPTVTSGVQGQPQTGTPTFNGGDTSVPINESVPPKLVDPTTHEKVNSVTVPGQGTYTANDNGTVTFTPDPGFVGTATPISVVRVDTNGTPAQTTYTPTVTAVAPTAEPAVTSGVQGQPQTGTPTFNGGDTSVPINESVPPKLVDPTTHEKVNSVTVPGQGTYTANDNGTVTFTPDPGFVGTATPISVVRVDTNGTPAQTTYTPTVTAVAPTAEPAVTSGVQGQPQTGTPTFNGGDTSVPINESVPPKLVDPTTHEKVSSVTVPDQGTYTANPDGTVTFQPVPQFTGEATPVSVERVDTNGTPVQTTYTPTVTPVTPTGTPVDSTGVQGQTQTGTPTFEGGDPAVPIDNTVVPKLVDPKTGEEVSNITIPDEGTYTIDENGLVTFTPEPQFKGDGTGVEVKRVDKNGTPVTAKYTPNVIPVTPEPQPDTCDTTEPEPPVKHEVPVVDVVPEPKPDTSVTTEPEPPVKHEVPVVNVVPEPKPDTSVTTEPEPPVKHEVPVVNVVPEPKPDTSVTTEPEPPVKHEVPVVEVAPEVQTVTKDRVEPKKHSANILHKADEITKSQVVKGEKSKPKTTGKSNSKHIEAKALPETGSDNNHTNTTLFGSIITLFGLLAFRRKQKNTDNK